jgi:8-oxo-dGTP diphosphatase
MTTKDSDLSSEPTTQDQPQKYRPLNDFDFKRANPNSDYGNFPITAPVNGAPTPYERAVSIMARELGYPSMAEPEALVNAVLREYGIDDAEDAEIIRYAADAIVFASCDDVRYVLLIRRGWSPDEGKLALPGGHAEEYETGLNACVRELAEEAGLVLTGGVFRFVGIYDAPGRDSRGRYVSAAFATDLGEMRYLPSLTASSDAAGVEWVPLGEVLSDGASMRNAFVPSTQRDDSAMLAFDHWAMISDALSDMPVHPESEPESAARRYIIAADGDGHRYVVEAEHADEWLALSDDEINDGLPWAWALGGSPTLLTFTDPRIEGAPLRKE